MIPEELIITASKREEIFEMKPEYPYIIRQVHSPIGKSTIAPWHWHEELEFVYVREGAVIYNTPQNSARLEAGNGIFVKSNVLHQVLSPEPASNVQYEVHMFRRNYLAEENSLLDKKYISPFLKGSSVSVVCLRKSTPDHKEILERLLSLSALDAGKSFGYEWKSRNLMAEVWMHVISLQHVSPDGKEGLSGQRERRIKEMLLYIQEYYMERLSLKNISGAANISERECLRCFQDILHTTPFMYLQEYRIQAACNMLRNSSDKIVDIAVKCGFSSGSYFGKTFRRQMNCTPYEYRTAAR